MLAALAHLGLSAKVDWPSTRSAMASVSVVAWCQIVILSLSSYVLRFLRWRRFLAAMGHRLPFLAGFTIYLAGFALTLSPGKAGEMIRSVYLRPHGVPYSASVGGFVAERLLDLVAVASLACLALPMLGGQQTWIFAAVPACIVLLMLMKSRLSTVLATRLKRLPFGLQAEHGLLSIGFLLSGRRLATALPFSFAAWIAQGLGLCVIVDALHFQLPGLQLVGIYCVSILAGTASFLPGGLGATEAAMSYLLATSGMAAGPAIAAALICRGLTLWLAVLVGVGAMTWLAATSKGRR